MFNKERYTPEARGAAMVAAFKRHALQCGVIAQQADRDIPKRDLDDLCRQAGYLVAELNAMRGRQQGYFE